MKPYFSQNEFVNLQVDKQYTAQIAFFFINQGIPFHINYHISPSLIEQIPTEKSELINQTLLTLPNQEQNSTIIYLQIPMKHMQESVSLLLKETIPFGMYFQKAIQPEVLKKNNSAPLVTSYSNKTNKNSNTLEVSNIPLDTRIIEAYNKYVANGFTNSPPSLENISTELKVSLHDFKSRFRTLYGKTFYQAYMDKRMEHAALLLKQGYKAVQVSKRIGYGEKSCIKFNKMFQKHFGMTPKKYQISFK